MYYNALKFLSREPKKTMNFVRDIAIPVILLLSVGAIIISVNLQLTNLLTLGGQNNILIIRNTQEPVENSTIPASLVNNLHNPNIGTVVPVIIQDAAIIVNKSSQLFSSSVEIVTLDLHNFTQILPFQSVQSSQLNNFSLNNIIIGSQIMQDLNLNPESLSSYSFIIPSTNVTLYP